MAIRINYDEFLAMFKSVKVCNLKPLNNVQTEANSRKLAHLKNKTVA